MKFVAQFIVTSIKIVGLLVCLLFFLNQFRVTVSYFLEDNIFQSSKTEKYSGKRVTPMITICPDPALLDVNISMEDVLENIVKLNR